MSDQNNADVTTSKSLLDNKDPDVWGILKWLIFLGASAIIILSIGSVWEKAAKDKLEMLGFLKSCGTALLISGACFSSGSLMGFLFAIPKLLQNTNLLPEQIKNDQTVILHNDNLVQISDWPTKIIVGVGLTQLNQIPEGLRSVGTQLGKSFGADDIGTNIAIGCVLYFVVVGFLASYIWTRLYFVKLLGQTNEELQKKQIRKLENAADHAVAGENKKTITESQMASDAAGFEQLKTDSSEVLKTALDELKEKVKEVLKNKPVAVPDDPQKGRWGDKAENNGKQIRATVVQSSVKGFYNILITVSDKIKPLDVPVAIFVHDSFKFPDDVIYVKPNENKLAQITLTDYEAFTIGAVFADGTELELDLNEQPGYPEGFYWEKKTRFSQT